MYVALCMTMTVMVKQLLNKIFSLFLHLENSGVNEVFYLIEFFLPEVLKNKLTLKKMFPVTAALEKGFFRFQR